MNSSVDLALQAFERRPSRAEALGDLARYYREKGMNEVAAMFAARVARIPASSDLLFVEAQAQQEATFDLSISGFYSCDEEMRRQGREACDRLALDRNAAEHIRIQARQNLHFYLKPISEVFPSWLSRRLTFEPPDGYLQMAPSVTRHGSRIVAAQRCVNYKIDQRGYVRLADDLPLAAGGKIHTRTLLLEIEPDTLRESVLGEILLPSDLPAPQYEVITGFEDMRLFEWCGELWSLSTVLDQNPDARAEQWLARIGADLRMCEARPINPKPLRARDKNWIPVVEGPRLRFIYENDPTRIIDTKGETVAQSVPAIAAEHLSGSSQAIPFAGGWLAVLHWRQWFDGWPKYRHRAVWYNKELKLKHLSPGWVFADKVPELDLLAGYEYCTGLCWTPDGSRLVIGYQLHEREAWVGVLAAEEMAAALGLASVARPYRTALAEPRAINMTGGGEDVNRVSTFDDERWVFEQTNRALQDKIAIDRATRGLMRLGVPEHPSRPKNWDTYLALRHCLITTKPSESVIDLGGDRNSVFLRGLLRQGYRALVNMNLKEPEPGIEDKIIYSRGDITATGRAASSIHFANCQSVLEHGVNWQRFLDEASRILVPGGYLFISVDYWETPVSTSHVVFMGSYAGQRWQIFTQAELHDMIVYAEKIGLIMAGHADFRCRDRAVQHLGCDFTFFNFLLRRQ